MHRMFGQIGTSHCLLLNLTFYGGWCAPSLPNPTSRIFAPKDKKLMCAAAAVASSFRILAARRTKV